MLNISGSTPGKNDTVLVQAEGKTGDQVERDTQMAKSFNEYSKAMGQVPERDQAQVYAGAGWKPIGGKDSGHAMAPDTLGETAGSVKVCG
jgi:hypothetical protein